MKRIFMVLVAAVFLFVATASYATDIRDDMNFKAQTVVGGFSLKIASIVMTGVDYTLSTAESLCSILIVTGSTSSAAIIAPTISQTGVSRLYTVRNAGADSKNVTIKKTSGTGVTIATGKTAKVFWSGSDYVRETADATH